MQRIGNRSGSVLSYSFSLGGIQFMDLALDVIHLYEELQRHARHRRSALRASAQHLRLEFSAVAPTCDLLGVFHGVHLTSLVDTILAAYTAGFKKGMAGRLLAS